MSGNMQAIIEQSCATCMPFACFEMKAGSATPTTYRSIVEASVTTLASFFVSVLLSVLLPVLLSCLTGLVHGLVGLTAQRASAAEKGV